MADQFGVVGGGDAFVVDAEGSRSDRVGVSVHRGLGVIRAGLRVPPPPPLAAAGELTGP